MSIVAIVASPRKGNSNAIVGAMTDAAKKNGKDVKIYYLNKLSNAKGCQACMGCKKSVGCVVKDDHAEILNEMRKAEGVILSTPDYFGEACGQFRLFQDRFYSFLGAGMASNIDPGKKLAVVVSCGGGVDGAKALADKLEKSMVNYFKFVSVGKMVFTGGNAPDEASKNKAILDEAAAIGKKL
ncbi:iron-sulfur flavoprotein [Candidatus Methanoplasma termitum]|uniref:Isf2 protein n=1 Tax=Candidatus Methanoplasma termitum TaxID=1577791 RepID=A0A0A7LC29_9ARCH|nr:flavodoxin family protein [Candidatus Methanoplasma termitum]AIZ56584.1 iron-sulfur flavoprotein [Candidatus Methanoplasma termitum]MCL2333831.1 flavodoxin family protein [Candidatus Methanoplasma sp.]